MNETAKGAARRAADDSVHARLEKDLTAVKKDVAHLSQQISEAVNALGAVAQRQARRGLRNGGQSVVSLMTVAPDRVATVENAARDGASPVGETRAGVIHERQVAPPAFGLGPGTRPTAAQERSREMEFLLMRLEGGAIMPDSIFGVLDNGNPGRLPPPLRRPLVGIQHRVGARLQVCRRRKTGDCKGGIFPRRFGCDRRVGPPSSWRAWKEIQAVVTRRPAIAPAPFDTQSPVLFARVECTQCLEKSGWSVTRIWVSSTCEEPLLITNPRGESLDAPIPAARPAIGTLKASVSRLRRARASRPRAAHCGYRRAPARTSRGRHPPKFRDIVAPQRQRTARRPCPSH